MILDVIFIIILILVIFWQGSMIYAQFSGAPTVYANDQAIIDAIALTSPKTGETIFDLGCGDAKSLIIASKKFGLKGIGVEISPYCLLRAKLNIFLAGERKNIRVKLGDIRDITNFSEADIVYIYLFEKLIHRIEHNLFESVNNNARIVTLAFKFKAHKPTKTTKTKNLGIATHAYLYKA